MLIISIEKSVPFIYCICIPQVILAFSCSIKHLSAKIRLIESWRDVNVYSLEEESTTVMRGLQGEALMKLTINNINSTSTTRENIQCKHK